MLTLTLFILFPLLFLAALVYVNTFEDISVSIIGVIASLIAAYFLFDWWMEVPVITEMFSNPILFVVAFLANLVLGAAYLLFWFWPHHTDKNSYKIALEINRSNEYNFTNTLDYKLSDVLHGRANRTKEERAEIKSLRDKFNASDDFITLDKYIESDDYLFKASNNKSLIANVIFMWFFDAIIEIFHQPFVWMRRVIYEYLAESLDKISKRQVKKLKS